MQFDAFRNKLKSYAHQLNPLLPDSGEWKNSHFVVLQHLICEELRTSPLMTDERRAEFGITISAMTLKRFFNKNYDQDSATDLRFMKTIHKLCIFMKFSDFKEFTDASSLETAASNEPEMYDAEYFRQFLTRFLHTDFYSYNFSLEEVRRRFSEFVFEDSPYLLRNLEIRAMFHERYLKLVRENNRSNYELISFGVKSLTETDCVLESSEFWNLVFISENTAERFIYNQQNEQLYFLKFRDGKWKIWDNYNPNTGHFTKESAFNHLL